MKNNNDNARLPLINDSENVQIEDSKKVVKNIVLVAFSNFIKLLAGVLVGFLLPKIMGLNDYGFYKTYTLYLGYVGLFHFGFCDGIYLLYAGKNFYNLDTKSFRTFTRFLIFFQAIITFIIIIFSLVFLNLDYSFIFICVAISLFASNITTYYQFISQITGRFKELSYRNLIQASLQAISVIVLTVLWYKNIISKVDYKLYIVIWTLILLLLTIWYVYTYRKLLFGVCNKLQTEWNNIKKFFIIGLPLMVANLVSSLILTIDKQFVNVLANHNIYTIAEFGVYSFAYTMLGVITTIISAISIVLYPTIKVFSKEKLKKEYNGLISIIAIVTSFCLLAYQPLCFIVNNWLSQYSDSLPIFRVILPGIILSSCVTMIMFNYYKALEQHVKFFVISVIILVSSLAADFIAYFTTSKMVAISVASVVVIFIWYIVVERILVKKWKINTLKNFIYIMLIILSFYLITYYISNIYISFIVYLFVYIIVTMAFYFNQIKLKFKLIKNN